MGEFSLTHLLLLGLIALIFFGPSRLPALGQSMGKAIRGFKQGLNEIDAEAKPVVDNSAPVPAAALHAGAQSQASMNASAQMHAEKEAVKV
jgi:sec-independent protein translocase protein TatA